MADEAITEEASSSPDLLMELLSSEELTLDTVDLRPSTFTTSDIRNVLLPLMTNLSIRVLYLPMDRIDLVCAKTITMMTMKNVGPPFEELHLSNLPSEEHNIESSESSRKITSMIISSLKQNKHIKKLHITPQAVLHQSIPSSIASILYDNTVLTSLNLRGCGISHAGATKISCALASNASITVLDLSNNQLGNAGICSVALALELNSTIQKLKLSGTNISQGGEAMVEALALNKSLEVLDMSRNLLDDVVVTKLARSLKLNTSLRQLSLRSNSFSTIGALCLSLALYDPKNLQTVLDCNHTIQFLDIDSNQLSSECIMHTNKPLRWNALSGTENETIRKKVSAFLLESESNYLSFRDYFEDTTTVQHLLPNVLGSIKNSTVMYYLVKNLAVHSITATSRPDALSVAKKSSSDSMFSTDDKCNECAKDDNTCAVPEFVNVNNN
mmetsp:Transcript_13879/g.21552  ORF Transcript_13879/g.21552 Transcript_13879/m.21552 type:complete len:443 (+) Transcript_13879:114-1442(+)